MTDHERIFEWLADGQFHCSTEMDFMRDARKRISEINKKKIIIEGVSCDGRCGTIHRSKTLKMRRWVQEKTQIPVVGVIENEKIKFNKWFSADSILKSQATLGI